VINTEEDLKWLVSLSTICHDQATQVAEALIEVIYILTARAQPFCFSQPWKTQHCMKMA
jgi:hypothetical protein